MKISENQLLLLLQLLLRIPHRPTMPPTLHYHFQLLLRPSYIQLLLQLQPVPEPEPEPVKVISSRQKTYKGKVQKKKLKKN